MTTFVAGVGAVLLAIGCSSTSESDGASSGGAAALVATGGAVNGPAGAPSSGGFGGSASGGAPGGTPATGGAPPAFPDAGEGARSGTSDAGSTAGDAGTASCSSHKVGVVEGAYRSCARDADCTTITRLVDCCGDVAILGINQSDVAVFEAEAGRCEKPFPVCGCFGDSAWVDDGARLESFTGKWRDIGVVCNAQHQCESRYIGPCTGDAGPDFSVTTCGK
jgi:hypothetical protein